MGVSREERIDEIGFGNLKLIQCPDEFCYGVDAVILAGFAAETAKKMKKAADLCCGTGIIPLILSHKTEAETITGFEIQENSYNLALRNVRMNGLEERIKVVNTDICEIDSSFYGQFDTVTMNPPYMESGRGIVNAGDSRMIARHEIAGDLDGYMKAASMILCDRGELFMVHRPSRLADIFCAGRKYRLEPKTMRMVKPREGEAANIVLVHFVKNGGRQLKVLKDMAVYGPGSEYSDEILSVYERI